MYFACMYISTIYIQTIDEQVCYKSLGEEKAEGKIKYSHTYHDPLEDSRLLWWQSSGRHRHCGSDYVWGGREEIKDVTRADPVRVVLGVRYHP